MTKTDNNRQETGGLAAQDGTGRAAEKAQGRGRRSEVDRSAELAISLPQRVQIGQWKDGRGKPWFVRHGIERRVESFANEQDRNDRAEALAGALIEHGATALDVDMSEWRRYQDFRRRVPAPLHELESLWLKHGRHDRILATDACTKYLALRTQEMGNDNNRHMGLHLRRMCEACGKIALNDITPAHLRTIVAELLHPKTGKPMALQTKHDHLKNWNTFFERSVLEGWCDKNPCALVMLPQVLAVDKEILKPREVFDLLKANRKEPVIGRMAFEVFGGLRASSAARLASDHVKREKKAIRLPGAVIDEETNEAVINHKSRKTVFRQGHPEVLWAWFDHIGEKMWTIRKGSYDEYKRQAFIRSGVNNPGNILRDTFASYLFAATNNLPLVSSLMQHTSIKTTLIYVGVAEEGDAKLVMAMTPAAVALTWDKFLKRFG